MPLGWIIGDHEEAKIQSLSYYSATPVKSTGCETMVFEFYNDLDQGFPPIFFTPGQNKERCHVFNSIIVAYSGKTIPFGKIVAMAVDQ